MNNHKVKCSNFEIANNKPFTLIAGPCQLESEQHALDMAGKIKEITNKIIKKLRTLIYITFFLEVKLLEYSFHFLLL